MTVQTTPLTTSEDLTPQSLVGAIATAFPLATRVFSRHAMDFCCGGGRPLAEVCEEKGLNVETVLQEIRAEVDKAPDSPSTWADANLNDLIEHILAAYHVPLKEELPRIEAMLRKVHRVHGDKNQEAFDEMLKVYLALKDELVHHMMKEEQILFPMIKRGQGSMAMGPVTVMEAEHESAGNALKRLRELTDNYVLPEGACNTWRSLWVGLETLEGELHQHIHLENNILFPRAMQE